MEQVTRDYLAHLMPDTPRASFTRPASATVYAAGDAIANSTTGSEVVPLSFTVPRRSGLIVGVQCVIAPASGNLVITNCAFDLLVFRPATDIPFAAGSFPADNAALAVTAAAYRQLIGVWSFVATAWRNPAGGLTADAVGYQRVAHGGVMTVPFAARDLAGALVGVVQAQAAWDPTAVAQAFDFTLDLAG